MDAIDPNQLPLRWKEKSLFKSFRRENKEALIADLKFTTTRITEDPQNRNSETSWRQKYIYGNISFVYTKKFCKSEGNFMTKASTTKIKRERSTSYPNFGLHKAIHKLQLMYSQVKSQGVKRETLETVFGTKTAMMGEIVATLKQFDLVEAPRGETIKISPLGLKILLGTEKERREAFCSAAEKPELFKKYQKKWGQDIPTNEVCMSQLRLEDRFSERGATRFLTAFRETAQFVKEAPAPMRDISSETISPSSSKTDEREEQSVGNFACPKNEEKLAGESVTAVLGSAEQEATIFSKILGQISHLKNILDKLAPEKKEVVLKFLLS